MGRAALVVAVLFSGSAAGADVASDITPEVIAEAIKEGSTAKRVGFYSVVGGALHIGARSGVILSTPYMRIVHAANEAKRRYRPFTEADVTDEMKAPEIRVYAPAWAGQGMKVVSPEAIVILEEGRKDAVIQPTATKEMDAEFRNLLGAKAEGRSMLATFPLSALKEGNVIRIVWDIGKEMSHKIKMEKVR